MVAEIRSYWGPIVPHVTLLWTPRYMLGLTRAWPMFQRSNVKTVKVCDIGRAGSSNWCPIVWRYWVCVINELCGSLYCVLYVTYALWNGLYRFLKKWLLLYIKVSLDCACFIGCVLQTLATLVKITQLDIKLFTLQLPKNKNIFIGSTIYPINKIKTH